jgi:hypothetical protein
MLKESQTTYNVMKKVRLVQIQSCIESFFFSNEISSTNSYYPLRSLLLCVKKQKTQRKEVRKAIIKSF